LDLGPIMVSHKIDSIVFCDHPSIHPSLDLNMLLIKRT